MFRERQLIGGYWFQDHARIEGWRTMKLGDWHLRDSTLGDSGLRPISGSRVDGTISKWSSVIAWTVVRTMHAHQHILRTSLGSETAAHMTAVVQPPCAGQSRRCRLQAAHRAELLSKVSNGTRSRWDILCHQLFHGLIKRSLSGSVCHFLRLSVCLWCRPAILLEMGDRLLFHICFNLWLIWLEWTFPL